MTNGPRSIDETDGWEVTCPACGSTDLEIASTDGRCSECGHVLELEGGIWRFVPPSRLGYFDRFLETYTKVRVAEGRGYDSSELRALPECPATHPLAAQWRIRSRSYDRLIKILQARLDTGSRILDLGAGTGWLCHRLRELGYRPCAVDLSIDVADGLGAASAFEPDWPRWQAEFDRLPLADNSVEAAIFNASFHYCTDQEDATREAFRVLRDGGLLAILDTPIYRHASSGRQMLEDQQTYFSELIGERSDALPMTGFLTWRGLGALADKLGLSWHVERPWYGLRWAARPLLSMLRGRREPATFAIVWAVKPGPAAAGAPGKHLRMR